MFQKIHGESLDRGQDPIEKIISTITAINKRWPREVVNVRFFSRLKKLNVTLKGNSKKKSQNIETNCSIHVLELQCNKIKNLDNLLFKNR